MNTFTFNGVKCSEFNVFVSGKNTFGAPERDVTKYSVPGRDGDLVTDNGRFKNIPVSYPAFIPFDFQEHAPQFREWISAQRGYQRLEDDYDPNTFRMARFVGPLSFSPRTLNKSAEFQVAFDCKPQRFLKSGEYPLVYTEPSGRVFPNPSPFPSNPLLTVYGEGEGTVILSGETIRISAIKTSITLDCETQNAYSGAANRNGDIIVSAFPELPTGSVAYSFSGGVTSIEIIPRWWTV